VLLGRTRRRTHGNGGETFFDSPWHPEHNGLLGQRLTIGSMSSQAVSVPQMPACRLGERRWLFGRRVPSMVEAAIAAGADAIELNLGCPNVWAGREQKQIFQLLTLGGG